MAEGDEMPPEEEGTDVTNSSDVDGPRDESQEDSAMTDDQHTRFVLITEIAGLLALSGVAIWALTDKISSQIKGVTR